MELIVRRMDRAAPDVQPVEVVERKGPGHPDTLCDAIAERISVKLCRAYLEATGAVLHHNVDKVLLCGGASRPAFGGGDVLEPIEIHLAGRVTRAVNGTVLPVDELAVQACREVLAEHVPAMARASMPARDRAHRRWKRPTRSFASSARRVFRPGTPSMR